MVELLKQLTSRPSPCGFEHDAIRYIYEFVKPYADDVIVDGIGNVIAHKKGAFPGPKMMVSAHVDEVGFIIKKVEPNGLLKFEFLGGHDDRTLKSQRVTIRTKSGKLLRGVIGNISAHMRKYDDPNKVRRGVELYIDCGANSADDVYAMGVAPGDYVTYATEVEEFGMNKLMGKAFDDKAGCAVLIKALMETDFTKVKGDVYFVFSTMEEVGLRGAKVAVEEVKPDVALAVDTTAVSDTLENVMDRTLFLGKGVGIKIMDFSLIASVPVRNKLVKCAENAGIKYQMEIFPGIGTDAGAFGQAGIPSGVISVPSRYAHSPVEVIDLDELNGAKELLKEFILNLDTKEEFCFLNI